MGLEFYQELFLTAVISLLFAFLLSKLSGGGRGGEERQEHVLDSGKELRRQADEGFGTGEEIHGPEREIVEVEEHACAIEVEQESVEEKKVVRDISGEVEEKISEKMVEPEDTDRCSAVDLKDGEDKELLEESEADWFCSGFKIGLNQETENGSGGGEGVCNENKGESLLIGEDDWEGIERSGLEKRFGVASEYSTSPSGLEALARLSSDVQMDLYGLHKIATEGPCYEPQPLPLRASSRARWHAWQKLGSMTPEVAMEQYINLLSKSIPGLVVENYGEDTKLNRVADIPEKGILNTVESGSSLQIQHSPAVEMKSDDQDSDEIATGCLKVLRQGLTGTFFLNLLFPTRGAIS